MLFIDHAMDLDWYLGLRAFLRNNAYFTLTVSGLDLKQSGLPLRIGSLLIAVIPCFPLFPKEDEETQTCLDSLELELEEGGAERVRVRGGRS